MPYATFCLAFCSSKLICVASVPMGHGSWFMYNKIIIFITGIIFRKYYSFEVFGLFLPLAVHVISLHYYYYQILAAGCWLLTADITIVTMAINRLYRYVCTLYIVYSATIFNLTVQCFLLTSSDVLLFSRFYSRFPFILSTSANHFAFWSLFCYSTFVNDVTFHVIANKFTSYTFEIFHFVEFEMCKIYDPVRRSNNKHSKFWNSKCFWFELVD